MQKKMIKDKWNSSQNLKSMPIKLLFINPTLYARGNPLLIGCK